MSEQPITTVPEITEPLKWEDLAAQVGDGTFHPAFEPVLVEQLNARGIPIPGYGESVEGDNLQTGQQEAGVESVEITPAHHQHHVEIGEGVAPSIEAMPPVLQDAIGERMELGQVASGGLITEPADPSTRELDAGRAEVRAYAEDNIVTGLAKVERQIARIKAEFPDPDSMPPGAVRAIKELHEHNSVYQDKRQQESDAAAGRYDARKERLEAYGVPPKHFVDRWAGSGLMSFQVSTEARQADKAVQQLISQELAITPDRSTADMNRIVSKAIKLKRSSQQYIMENAEWSLEGWEVPTAERDKEVLKAIIPNLPRDIARQLYAQNAAITNLVDNVASDLAQRPSLWPHDTVCMVLDVRGYDSAEDLLHTSEDDAGGLKDQQVKRFAELLDIQEGSHTDLNKRLEYYRKRVETNHSMDQDLTIAASMITGMGIKSELAADIARSAAGEGGGFKQIGLDPSLAIVSIAQKVEQLGVNNIHRLHDEVGYTSFHRYGVAQLEFMLKVIDHDPAVLERLKGDNTLLAFIDATDDYSGGLSSLAEMASVRSTDGESLILEVGSMGGKYDTDTLMQKYADFLSERGIHIETLVIGGHGVEDSGGIIMGGLRIGPGSEMEPIDSGGMQALLDLMNEEGTIIVHACSQGAVNPQAGISTAGEFARVANKGNDKDIWAYGPAKPTAFYRAAEGGGIQSSEPSITVLASVEKDGSVREQVVDLEQNRPYVIPVPAIKQKGVHEKH